MSAAVSFERRLGLGAILVLLVAACGGEEATTTVPGSTNPASTSEAVAGSSTSVVSDEGCADVIDAKIEGADELFTVSATVRSADTGWDKYADLWQVQTIDGEVLGERVLAHPHETEQPFTRSLGGVSIPADVADVVIVARDSVAGFCGSAFTVEVPHQ